MTAWQSGGTAVAADVTVVNVVPFPPGGRGRRWRLQDAVELSALRPDVRLVLLVLLNKADVRTGVIPGNWQPSYDELERRTGLRRQDLAVALREAETLGWLVRKRGGGRDNPTRYTVKLPGEPGPEVR